jgi:hypothetical protein
VPTDTGLSGTIAAASIIAQTAQMMNEWNERQKDRDAWERRNTNEFNIKSSEFDRQLNQARQEQALIGQAANLDKQEVALQDREFDIAGARAYTGRRTEAAKDQLDEETAGIAGSAVEDFENYLFGLGSRAGDYEAEAKAFTDPLLAASPGSTVSGSRYVSEFDDMAKAASYARDDRKAEIDAFAQALGDSTNYLSGIDVGQAGAEAQSQKIQDEARIEGLDQALAAAGLTNKRVGISGKRADLDNKQADLKYQDIFGKIGSQRRLQNAAKAEGRTLTGQQSIQFPAGNILGNVDRLYKTMSTPAATFPIYGSGAANPYGVGTYNTGSKAGGF